MGGSDGDTEVEPGGGPVPAGAHRDPLGRLDDGHRPPEGRTVEVEHQDLNGDGVPDLTTTTTREVRNLRFGPGDPTDGYIATEIRVVECDEDHDGVIDWAEVSATERIVADVDGDGSIDITSVTERTGHDLDGDGVADLVETRVVEQVAVTVEGSDEHRVVESSYSRVDEPGDDSQGDDGQGDDGQGDDGPDGSAEPGPDAGRRGVLRVVGEQG